MEMPHCDVLADDSGAIEKNAGPFKMKYSQWHMH